MAANCLNWNLQDVLTNGAKELAFLFPDEFEISENWRCCIAALVSLSVITFSFNTFF